MNIVISNKELKVVIMNNDDLCGDCQSCRNCKIPPKYPAGVKFPMSLKDKRKMDEQVEAANHILEEE